MKEGLEVNFIFKTHYYFFGFRFACTNSIIHSISDFVSTLIHNHCPSCNCSVVLKIDFTFLFNFTKSTFSTSFLLFVQKFCNTVYISINQNNKNNKIGENNMKKIMKKTILVGTLVILFTSMMVPTTTARPKDLSINKCRIIDVQSTALGTITPPGGSSQTDHDSQSWFRSRVLMSEGNNDGHTYILSQTTGNPIINGFVLNYRCIAYAFTQPLDYPLMVQSSGYEIGRIDFIAGDTSMKKAQVNIELTYDLYAGTQDDFKAYTTLEFRFTYMDINNNQQNFEITEEILIDEPGVERIQQDLNYNFNVLSGSECSIGLLVYESVHCPAQEQQQGIGAADSGVSAMVTVL